MGEFSIPFPLHFKGGEMMANDQTEKEQTIQEEVEYNNEKAENEKEEMPDQEELRQEGSQEEKGEEQSSSNAEEELVKANEKIAELEAKLEEMENRMLRAQADFENFRRRSRLDMEAQQKYRAQSLISDLLPAIDNFERALKIEAEDEKTKSVLQGMEMVYRQILQALENEGVEVIEAVGKPFDPHLHQAVMQVKDENFESNVVVEELQKGYKLKDRVIRPSMVKVNE
jgi:Molecular chaperone GrpE (heat shock protein)